MNHHRRHFAAAASAMLAGHWLAPSLAFARDVYPSKPVKIVVPYSPGAASDTLGRLAAEVLAAALGQPFVVDNRAGGGTVIGTRSVATAAPDGYLLGFVDTAFVINPALLGKQLNYDTVKDFEPVTEICRAPLVLVANPSVKANTLKEFIALAKADPGKLSYGSSGVGSAPHLAGQQLRQEAGIDIVHVPYRGGATVYTDLLGGQIQFSFGTVPSMLQYIRSGRMRALAVTAAKRTAELPNVPTMAEEGLAGVNAEPLFGLVAPARTPRDIVERVSSTVAASVRNGELNRRLQGMGFIPVGSTPEEFARTIGQQIERWGEVIRKGNIKPE
ncbi:Bug family tripartite tricarboxylate transporter substrate binding protein [Paracidovorax citrulli]